MARCGECRHFREFCCDYGVCMEDVERIECKNRGGNPVRWAVTLVFDRLPHRDAQEEIECDSYEPLSLAIC